MKKTLLLITILLLLGNVCKGMEPGRRGYFWTKNMVYKELYYGLPELYQEDGPFVIVPAAIGEYSITVIGSILVFPFSLGSSVLDNESPDIIKSFSDSHYIFGPLSKAWFGLPFYCIKKVFWDGPVYLYEAVAGEDEQVASTEAK